MVIIPTTSIKAQVAMALIRYCGSERCPVMGLMHPLSPKSRWIKQRLGSNSNNKLSSNNSNNSKTNINNGQIATCKPPKETLKILTMACCLGTSSSGNKRKMKNRIHRCTTAELIHYFRIIIIVVVTITTNSQTREYPTTQLGQPL